MFRMTIRLGLLVLACVCLLVLASATFAQTDDPVPNQPAARWWKGNIHTHSFWSDGNQFPEMIAEWYRTRDYNFLALSDHNILSSGPKWMKHAAIVSRGGPDVVDKYRARFGGSWVETRGTPGKPDHEVRLKPLEEFRALVEERGKFIMIQGEEISDSVGGKPVHMNATNLQELIRPAGGKTVREAIANNLRAVEDQAKRLNRQILLHLNHPNFGWAVSAEDLAFVTEEKFFEVYNGHPAINHLGDKTRPSIERMWDICNTIRLGELNAAPMYGVGTDDSHHYHGRQGSRPGRGWIMVRSEYLTPEHLLRAINAGDFYASSGVVLDEVAFNEETKTLELKIAPEDGVTYTTQFVGTLSTADRSSTPRVDKDGKPTKATRKYSEEIGKVLATETGLNPRYKLTGEELYVRAVVTSTKSHPDGSFANQKEQAWTQPVGWKTKRGSAPAE